MERVQAQVGQGAVARRCAHLLSGERPQVDGERNLEYGNVYAHRLHLEAGERPRTNLALVRELQEEGDVGAAFDHFLWALAHKTPTLVGKESAAGRSLERAGAGACAPRAKYASRWGSERVASMARRPSGPTGCRCVCAQMPAPPHCVRKCLHHFESVVARAAGLGSCALFVAHRCHERYGAPPASAPKPRARWRPCSCDVGRFALSEPQNLDLGAPRRFISVYYDIIFMIILSTCMLAVPARRRRGGMGGSARTREDARERRGERGMYAHDPR